MNRLIALLLLSLIAGLLILSTGRAQSLHKKRLPESKGSAETGGGPNRVAIPAGAFSKQRAAELKEKVERAAVAALEVDNPSGCPLIISDAGIKASRGEADFPASMPKESGYAFKLNAKISSRTDQKITSFTLMLARAGTEQGVIIETGSLLIEPRATYTFGDEQGIYFSYFSSAPSKAILKVIGVEYEDGSMWNRLALRPETEVDAEPVPLNEVQPRFTDEALRNRVEGVVVVRLLVGTDGYVKQVRITSGLPDGLDEMAIQAAYQMRFKPATKNGEPVAHWITLPIKFEPK